MDVQKLKIIYDEAGKIMNLKDLTYNQLLTKLTSAFKLKSTSFYNLYYIDQDDDNITISTKEDFQIFIKRSEKKKLYLQKTDNSLQHFDRQYKGEIIYSQMKEKTNIKEKIILSKKELTSKLQLILLDLQQNLKKEMSQKLDQIYKTSQKSGKWSQTIHQKIKCDKCKQKNDIKGIRYECTECNFNLCQGCEQSDNHNHPLIQIINPSQAIATKNNKIQYLNTNQISSSKPAQGIKKKKYPKIFEQFLAITGASQEKALQFCKKYSSKKIQELIELYFQENDN